MPSIKPDVGIDHEQKADRAGNVLIEGILGVQKEVVLSSRYSIVTVEEIVDDLEASPNSCVLPAWTINAIATVPFGAKPSYTHGYYPRDNSYYKRWDSISREREPFLKWLDEEVFQAGE